MKFAGMMIAVLCLFFLSSIQPDPSVDFSDIDPEILNDKYVKDYNVYALPLPANASFADESVPLNDIDVRERLDRELLVNTYWQSNGLLLIKRAHRYFPEIEKILAEEGVPDDFKYLALIESGFLNVVSPAGATGFWQFMKATAKEYGLEVNDNVDERYNLEKSTRAACQYLKDSKEQFGSWTMAAAAYNAGNSGIKNQVNRQQTDNYYDLLLNTETGRYVFRILALKYILEEAPKYGFNYEAKDLYPEIPVTKVKVDTAITDLVKFARKYDLSYKALKIHNPWLRDTMLNNRSGKEYLIEIPEANFYK